MGSILALHGLIGCDFACSLSNHHFQLLFSFNGVCKIINCSVNFASVNGIFCYFLVVFWLPHCCLFANCLFSLFENSPTIKTFNTFLFHAYVLEYLFAHQVLVQTVWTWACFRGCSQNSFACSIYSVSCSIYTSPWGINIGVSSKISLSLHTPTGSFGSFVTAYLLILAGFCYSSDFSSIFLTLGASSSSQKVLTLRIWTEPFGKSSLALKLFKMLSNSYGLTLYD